jgi:hypothetical protein
MVLSKGRIGVLLTFLRAEGAWGHDWNGVS